MKKLTEAQAKVARDVAKPETPSDCKLTLRELYQLVKPLRAAGLGYGHIAQILCSKGYKSSRGKPLEKDHVNSAFANHRRSAQIKETAEAGEPAELVIPADVELAESLVSIQRDHALEVMQEILASNLQAKTKLTVMYKLLDSLGG